jgi:glycosyltransferase involved in cell wall biosynthesis
MKIAIFTNNYLPNIYGVPMSIETFRHEFEKQGHEVFIFAPNFPGYQDKEARVFRYPSLDINVKFRLPLGIPYSRKMDKILGNLNIDIIHSNHPNLLGSAALKWAQKKKIPLVFTWHTLYDQYTNFVPFLPAKFSASWIIKKAVKYANQADAVVVPTASVTPIIQKWGVKNKIIPIATGVVENEFTNPNRAEIRRRYGITENEILLLLISRLTEEKNIHFLFETAVEILKRNSKIKFMLAGDGYLLPGLKIKARKENLENRIIFQGLVPRQMLKNYYAAGDIFICASKSETQGMNVSEAMYSGLPIVAVEAPGSSSLVENGRNGMLTAEDKEEFIGAVEKLVGDKNLRKNMGEESARLAREKYTSKICADKMLDLYRSLIGGNT